MKGILLLGSDPVINGRAKAAGLPVQTGGTPSLPFDKTLIVAPGTRVPFDLLPAAWGFLDQWDAAVPLYRYDMTAAQVGTEAERAATQAVIRDLRVLLHSTELLFVRRNEAGQALLAAWLEEMGQGQDKRLAFLRALYRVKPCLCVLPVSWLVPVAPVVSRSRPVKSPNAGKPLVRLELAPGRYVKVHKGDEERALAAFARQRKGR